MYINAATDTYANAGSLIYGGRVVTAGIDRGCLFCLGHLDQRQIRQATMTDDERAIDGAIYGVPTDTLDGTGPSVVNTRAGQRRASASGGSSPSRGGPLRYRGGDALNRMGWAT